MAFDFDVAVIGAGISGVAGAKNLVEDGLSVVVFEATDHVGGLWQFMESGYGVMRFTHINVSKHNYCFSDFPFPDETPDYPHWEHMARYINAYVDRFNLRKLIRFRTLVKQLKRDADERGWTVETEDGQGNKSVVHVRSVVVATGHHAKPVVGSFPGDKTFSGEMYHSVDYKDCHTNKLTGKRVLVVGIGNSAVDVAMNATTVAARTTISTRSGAWVLQNYLFGVPTDHYVNRLLLSLDWKPVFPKQLTGRLICRDYHGKETQGDPEEIGLRPKYHAMQSQPTVSQSLYYTVKRGHLDIKPDIAQISGSTVTFTDGTKGDFDVIILCTGYRIDLPFIDPAVKKLFVNEEANSIRLYKNVFIPAIGPSLAFVGFLQPTSGGLLTMSEIQARWFGQIMKGRCKLPSSTEMERAIAKDNAKVRERFSSSARHTIQADPILYTDEIASFFGAKPSIWRHPHLAYYLLFGACGAYQYRLQGPGKWSKAAEYVRKVPPPPLYKWSLIVTALPFVLYLLRWALLRIYARRDDFHMRA